MKPLKAATAGRHFVVSTVLEIYSYLADAALCGFVPYLTLRACVCVCVCVGGGVDDGHHSRYIYPPTAFLLIHVAWCSPRDHTLPAFLPALRVVFSRAAFL